MNRKLANAGLACALTFSVIAAAGLTGCGEQPAQDDTETTATVATSSGQAVGSQSGSTAGQSSVAAPEFDFGAGLDEDGRWEGVHALDYVTLCDDYDAIQIPSSALDVSDKVEKRLETLASNAGVDELTDDWVKENFGQAHGWNTVEELRAGLTETFLEDAEKDYIQDYVVEHSTFSEIPQALIDYQEKYLVYQYEYMAAQYNFTLEDLIKMMYGYTSSEELVENNRDTVESQAKMYLVFQAIAEKEGKSVSDDDLATLYGDNLDSYEQSYGAPYLKMTALMDTTLDELVDEATVVDDGEAQDAADEAADEGDAEASPSDEGESTGETDADKDEATDKGADVDRADASDADKAEAGSSK